MTVRTETDAKHPYSLGISGVAPPTPGISGYDPTIVQAPLPDFWATGAIELYDDDTGESRSVVQITGSADDDVYAQTLVVGGGAGGPGGGAGAQRVLRRAGGACGALLPGFRAAPEAVPRAGRRGAGGGGRAPAWTEPVRRPATPAGAIAPSLLPRASFN